MRLIGRSVALVLALVLLPAATAFAQDGSASASASTSPSASVAPSQSLEPSGSPLPDADITLEPSSESIPFRTWAIAVTGGSASVELLEVEDFGSSFPVTVDGQSATVTMTLTLPPDLVLAVECFDFGDQEIGSVEPPNRLVLEVVQGGSYTCRYDTVCAGPPMPPLASVALYVSTDGFDVSRRWAVSVTDGRAVSFGCSPSRISTLTLEPDFKLPDTLFGAFRVEPFGESATVEIAAPPPRGGAALVAADCEDQDSEGLLRSVLVPPGRLVFDVVPNGFHVCYVQGRPGAVPPTDTAPGGRSDAPSGTVPIVTVLLAGVFAASLLVGVRARRPAR